MELEHRYGKNVHIFDNAYLNSLLARLCSPETMQPLVNHLVELLYSQLVQRVVEHEFRRKQVRVPTRMTAAHPDQLLESYIVDPEQRAIVINLARAGTFPSHICYETLNYILNPQLVRQDHILAARMTDLNQKVTGTAFGGSKIGGDIQDAVVIFPDPMGATGGTIVSSVDHYKNVIAGHAVKFIALHLIVTPEYLKRVTHAHPDLQIYAVRVDRGLSPGDVLRSVPGTFWDRERGLNDHDYILPGGGGFGEILNNSFV